MRESQAIRLFEEIALFLDDRRKEVDQIPEARRKELTQLAAYLQGCLARTGTAKLTFICTHNSRRSHLSQIWAKVAADAYGLTGVQTFSGGTEATAMNPRVVDCLRRCGFTVGADDPQSANPVYLVRYSDGFEPLPCFSKVYDQSPNPMSGYGAVMTCSSADNACPIVPGCDFRAAIRYEDPKVADGTPEEAAVYDERSKQICREMLFVCSEVERLMLARNNDTQRRGFLKRSLAIAAGLSIASLCQGASASATDTTQTNPDGFFTLGRRRNHWWLITPDGKPFFSIGLNHIDPASLRYPENIHLWREKYGGSTIRWIKESVAPNLKSWGFNTVGWVQEVTVRKWRHSRAFTVDEYRALDMPYCHLLPFMESHQWEKHTVHYDFRSEDWKEWCDYVARSHCAELANEKNLIGYFYSDCPTWIHSRPDNQWRGPIFDPEQLETKAGRGELSGLAHSYYKTTHDAIRRYDKHHLILGDRYEANAPIAMEVIRSALAFVDVLSFQDFRDPVGHLKEWHEVTGKPVLLADAARIKWQTFPDEFTRNEGGWYAETIAELFQYPGCVGFHLCGAYQRNRARRYGLLDEQEEPDQENVDLMKAANEKIFQSVKTGF